MYDSLSILTLAEMFELETEMVHSIISKMIINEELMVRDKDAATVQQLSSRIISSNHYITSNVVEICISSTLYLVRKAHVIIHIL